ncbi:MAG: hypothetical protein II936_07310 [Oscillospiraceae bacterium]|nr:hypothetical protein [Oscillospiraceae bacterium]
MERQKPYYLDQNGWSSEDYYSLHRYLHRLILKHEQRSSEIALMNTSLMSEKTKVLLYCIIKYYGLEMLFKLPNLSDIADCKPLSEPLVLGTHDLREPFYYDMNVVF